ncbi:putative ABC transport system permease protein [Glycomyces sambucus]|uniref:Putative ABC transport system permease protein n=1 Tax=Glycomyces sambucus TaxID=380244 RepID=A0A1G9J798_9ACTN|nr:FtsX-like permease family protein [Glycomyces sambucus]SDL33221.1 putative ABC transport system permease protein [Glycomyces sambucus]
MLLLAWNTFRERWQVFAGAILTVCLGVALVQSSLLALVAAATAPIPAGLAPEAALALQGAYDGALTLLSMVLALAAFVAVFIVASTFGFTVAQRRRELALLRLTGASRGQVRSLLTGEAVLLGLAGSVLGIALGLPLARFQTWLLVRLDFAPAGFAAPWRPWVVAVSLGTGVLIAVLGVLAASRRAAAIRPQEALREDAGAAQVMTVSRWVLGLVFTAGAVVLFVLFPAGDAAMPVWFVQLTPFLVTVPLVVGFAALAPLIVPLAAGLLGLVCRGALGELALANLRSDARRSAATAAPVMVLFAFTAGIGGTLATVGEAGRQELHATVDGDFAVAADRDATAAIAGIDGVAAVSAETEAMFELAFAEAGASWYVAGLGTVVDPDAYVATHDIAPVAGDLADLSGASVAVSPSEDYERDWRVGDTLRMRLGGEEFDVRVAALLPPTVAGPHYLLSPDLLPEGAASWNHVVRLADGADRDAVAASLNEIGTVSTVDGWIAASAAADERLTRDIMIVLLGMTMLYTAIAIVNAVVIAASNRRREFAAARVTGLGRGQVVWLAFLESQAVVAIGLVLGALAAAGSVLGAAVALRHLVGITAVSVQWSLLVGLAVGAAVIVGATSLVTALSATRTPPIRLVASRE